MTDHYAEAHRELGQVGTNIPYPQDPTTAAIAIAQVHATLELAEQQRIANLIALNEQWEESEHPDWYAQPQRLRPDIARALRIETP